MVQEQPTAVSALDKHRQRVADRKGRRSIEVLPPTKGLVARADKGSVDPSQKSKKCPRDGGNVATTTRSPGSMPKPSPGRGGPALARAHGTCNRASRGRCWDRDITLRPSGEWPPVHAQSPRCPLGRGSRINLRRLPLGSFEERHGADVPLHCPCPERDSRPRP